MKIAFHKQAMPRHTADSHLTHWDLSEDQVLALIHEAMPEGPHDETKPLTVSIPPVAFHSPIVKLEKGDKGVWKYEPRFGEEEPRKQHMVVKPGATKLPAGQVDVILYPRALLLEGNEATTDADFEVATINASADGSPMLPETFIANHLGLSGGTDHGYTDEEAWEELRKLVAFWNSHAQLAPAG